jgi:glycosyltransferase involved in cell wall biosynthesis
VLAPFWPPDYIDNAGSLHVRHRVNALQRYCDVTLITQQGDGVSPHELGVDRRVRLVALHKPRRPGILRRGLSFARRSLAGELTPGRRVVAAWCDQLRNDDHRFDVVEVHWSQHFSVVDKLRDLYPDAVLVAYAHDVMTQALRRRAAGSPSTIRRMAARVAARRATSLEPELLNRFDSVATFSDKDGALLRSLGVRVPIRVEQLYFELPERSASLKGSTVLFLGALYRPENDQAARWLITDIWPAVRVAVPDSDLLIVGSGPSAELRRLADQDPRVRAPGFVHDLSGLYQEAAVVIVPLLVGAGVKLKVIEALASGLPVVATRIGAEGLPRHLFAGVSDDAAELARITMQLLTDLEKRRAAGAVGRQWAESAHTRLEQDVSTAVQLYHRSAVPNGKR